MNAVDKVYEAIDNLIAEVPGWGKFILRASEPMFQVLDTIEYLAKENDSERGTDDNTSGNETEEEATSA